MTIIIHSVLILFRFGTEGGNNVMGFTYYYYIIIKSMEFLYKHDRHFSCIVRVCNFHYVQRVFNGFFPSVIHE